MPPVTNNQIASRRLQHQWISHAAETEARQVVEWMGAVQAQDYNGCLWALGLRLPNATEAQIEEAVASASIVRTWPMRGTIHLAPAADVRWMLDLLAPRVLSSYAFRFRRAGLDEKTFGRCRDLWIKALEGGKRLTRGELYDVLERERISTHNTRGLFITFRMALEGLICFAGREGKQQTFALLSEWTPNARVLSREESLAELALRYFTSHGPATPHDFSWWTGLALGDARLGIELARSRLSATEIEGKIYWTGPSKPGTKRPGSAFLLPSWDEYLIGYADRSSVIDDAHLQRTRSLLSWRNAPVIVDGLVVGDWKRKLGRETVTIEVRSYRKLTERERRAVSAAAARYGAFLGKAAELVF